MTDQLSGGLELRPARPEEFDACRATLERSFVLPVYDEDREVELATFEPERSLGVFDGGEPVATAGIYGLDLTVPGGPLPVAGVTWISVLPTYRRRGPLTAMLSRQLRELHEGAGEPVAALFASEPGIYGPVRLRPGRLRVRRHRSARRQRIRRLGAGGRRPAAPGRSRGGAGRAALGVRRGLARPGRLLRPNRGSVAGTAARPRVRPARCGPARLRPARERRRGGRLRALLDEGRLGPRGA